MHFHHHNGFHNRPSKKLSTCCLESKTTFTWGLDLTLIFLIPILEKAIAPHSSTLAWKIPWTEEPGRLQSMGSRRLDTTEQLHFHFSLACIGEGNGNPLQCSCLENPGYGGAWWATVHGVTKSWTQLSDFMTSRVATYKRRYLLEALFKSHYNSKALGLYTGEGNSTPLQYSCLENPMDRGAW